MMILKNIKPIHVSQIINLLIMSGILSFLLSTINHGLAEIKLLVWLKTWGIAFALAMTLSFTILPWIQKKILSLFENWK